VNNEQFRKETEAKLQALHDKVDNLTSMLQNLLSESKAIGTDWISEQRVFSLTGLSRSSLFYLRREGKLTSSSIGKKAVFYRLSDIERLLNENEMNR